MRIDPDNGWIRLTDETGQSAETREAGLTDFRVTVNSYDWGGSTKLQVVADLEGGQTVLAHVRGHADQHALSLPRDENQNHIADWWEHWFELADVGESADDDDTPAGDGDHGDSIALSDEYRGFHVHAAHERLSPEIKDLFIWDRDGIGFGLYAQATGVQTHLIWSVERSAKAGGANDNLVTPNGRRGDVFAVLLVNAPIEDGVVGEAEGGPGVPRNISKVTVDARLARLAYGMAAEMGLASTIGHELGHATNIWHHGADPPDYSVDEGRCGEAHGRTRTWTCPAGDCLEVAGKGGKYSGDDQCLMRYDMARFYENDAGVCWWRHGGVTVKGSVYGKDVPGTTLCESARGTGVNDPANKDNKAGDATKGDCAHQLCLKNESH
jgi:hypothetical protein